MIEINLLPEELRIKTKEKEKPVVDEVTVKTTTGPNQDKLFIYAIPAILGISILIHAYFFVSGITKNQKLASLKKQWSGLAPQKLALDEFNLRYSSATQDSSFTKLLISQRIQWAKKLNKLSLNLPPGVWFNEISLTKQNITIQGSVVSLQKDELGLINKLLNNLKADNGFFKDFVRFELTSVQKKTVGSYDVSDFVISGALK